MGAFQEGVGPFAFDPYQGPAARNVSDTKLIRSLGRWAARGAWGIGQGRGGCGTGAGWLRRAPCRAYNH